MIYKTLVKLRQTFCVNQWMKQQHTELYTAVLCATLALLSDLWDTARFLKFVIIANTCDLTTSNVESIDPHCTCWPNYNRPIKIDIPVKWFGRNPLICYIELTQRERFRPDQSAFFPSNGMIRINTKYQGARPAFLVSGAHHDWFCPVAVHISMEMRSVS